MPQLEGRRDEPQRRVDTMDKDSQNFGSHAVALVETAQWKTRSRRTWGIVAGAIVGAVSGILCGALLQSIGTMIAITGPACYVTVHLIAHHRKKQHEYKKALLKLGGNCDRKTDGRLVCHGDPAELLSIYELQNAAFEPIIVSTTHLGRRGAVLLCAPVLGIYIILRLSGVHLSVLAAGVLGALAAMFALAVDRIYSTYYRISPGRLELLKGRRGSAKVKRTKEIPLRGAKIICRYDERRLRIWPAGAESSDPQVISLGAITDAQTFVSTVFRAALVPTPAPPLPDDELLG